MVVVSSIGIKIKQSNAPVIHHKLPLHFFFPTDFQSEAKAIHIWNISIKNPNITSLEDIDWKCNNAFVIVEAGAYLFCNGALQYILEKPGLNVFNMKTEFFNISSGSANLILISETKDVYFVTNQGSFKENSFLQISKTWTNIRSVLCGDILMNGSKQLLLLKHSSSDDWQDDYSISNFSGFVPVDYISKNLEKESNMNRAIPSVQAKVLSGKRAIYKAQSTILMKMEATLDSLHKLNTCSSSDIETDHHISSFQQSLVDLILCKDEQICLKGNAEVRVNLILLNHWKKLFDDHWILCWTFSNEDNRTIYSPVMNIWISGKHIQSFQKVFVHACLTFSIEDECRKEINSKENFSVMVYFKTFEFHPEILNVHAVLSWYVGSEVDFENELFLALEEKVLIQQQMLLMTNLSVSDVFDTKYKDLSTFEDLACVKILQHRVVFTFSSLMTNLLNIEKKFPFISDLHMLPQSENTNLKIFKGTHLFMTGVHITFKIIKSSTVEAEIFIKNDDQLFLLEKYFYQYLPTDVVMIPNGLTASEIIQLKQQAVCSMKDEIDLLLSLMNIYNIQGKLENFNFQPGTVIVAKENFLRIRKALLKKECRTDNILQRLHNFNFFRKTN
ncbi:uncharacterized protein NPIL_444991 [Nephila pilipes]|uniref:Uncharacterized protein n=1 Tax=Nephila pilipes TaxID=299642 RepID=A0A8X6UH21_NEPPI|nr:uncharacterized protein NPIL_444991 [Nephila pilipes]